MIPATCRHGEHSQGAIKRLWTSLEFERKYLRALLGLHWRLRGAKRPIVIYQMGKVGSRTVYDTLNEGMPDVPVLHVHWLTDRRLREVRRLYRTRYRHSQVIPGHVIAGGWVSRQMRRPAGGPWKVITLVRDPVAQDVSSFFQTMKMFHPDLSHDGHADERRIQETLERFLHSHDHDHPQRWMDDEFSEALDIDPYSIPLDIEEGYTIYRSSHLELLILRLEDLERCGIRALEEFLDRKGLVLRPTNIGRRKAYADLYQRFLAAFNPPHWYLERMYSSRFVQHFYASDEIAAFRNRWERAPAEQERAEQAANSIRLCPRSLASTRTVDEPDMHSSRSVIDDPRS